VTRSRRCQSNAVTTNNKHQPRWEKSSSALSVSGIRIVRWLVEQGWVGGQNARSRASAEACAPPEALRPSSSAWLSRRGSAQGKNADPVMRSLVHRGGGAGDGVEDGGVSRSRARRAAGHFEVADADALPMVCLRDPASRRGAQATWSCRRRSGPGCPGDRRWVIAGRSCGGSARRFGTFELPTPRASAARPPSTVTLGRRAPRVASSRSASVSRAASGATDA
jgi:hypothetical protein